MAGVESHRSPALCERTSRCGGRSTAAWDDYGRVYVMGFAVKHRPG